MTTPTLPEAERRLREALNEADSRLCIVAYCSTGNLRTVLAELDRSVQASCRCASTVTSSPAASPTSAS